MEPILLYDTTLRDGTQGENISFSADEKLTIAQRLDDIGVHYIEGGWPGSNPRDMHFFEIARREHFRHARLTAFGSTRRPDRTVEEDPNLVALLQSGAPVLAIFGKTWDLHVRQIMDNSLPENITMIRDTVAFLKAYRNVKDICSALDEAGMKETSVGIAQCGLPEERIYRDIQELIDQPPEYWTLVLAKKNKKFHHGSSQS